LISTSTHDVELDGDVDVDSIVVLDLDPCLVMSDEGATREGLRATSTTDSTSTSPFRSTFGSM
jgi:hypothetical protein